MGRVYGHTTSINERLDARKSVGGDKEEKDPLPSGQLFTRLVLVTEAVYVGSKSFSVTLSWCLPIMVIGGIEVVL